MSRAKDILKASWAGVNTDDPTAVSAEAGYDLGYLAGPRAAARVKHDCLKTIGNFQWELGHAYHADAIREKANAFAKRLKERKG